MKTLFIILLLASAQIASAIEIPRSVHRIGALDTARTEAATRGKPVCFLYTKESLRLS